MREADCSNQTIQCNPVSSLNVLILFMRRRLRIHVDQSLYFAVYLSSFRSHGKSPPEHKGVTHICERAHLQVTFFLVKVLPKCGY